MNEDHVLIRELIQNWAIYRDSGDWERFAKVWSNEGWMTATWFQGHYPDFIAASKKGYESGLKVLHELGGTAVDVQGDRAIAQTRMNILQRATVHDVEVDIVCTGRFYDFIRRDEGEWKIVRRQPIYEKDRLDTVDPSAVLKLDPERLAALPEGYRYLGYAQELVGYQVLRGLPSLFGPEVELLYREGAAWLNGSAEPGVPLSA